jgi:signal peptidase I
MRLALILVVLTAVSGAVVLYNRFFLQRKEDLSDGEEARPENILVEYSRSFFPVLFFVLIIRSFIFEPFRIPSGSMMPTLLQGDYIFVKKYTYGLRLPVIEKKMLQTGDPARGDVAVFRLPSDPNINYIKRVVGLPGDRVVYKEHRLTINGEEIELNRDSDTSTHDDVPQFVENLSGREHAILISRPGNTARDGVYIVPQGSYFMMGDNRDNSRDSRFIGVIADEFLVGEAVRIWMHMDGIEWPTWSRIGTKIQ